MMAALFGRTEIVRLLTAHGANPALKDNAGNTAVDLAQQQGDPQMVTLLGGG
jgi:ankyrin repeat protein